MPLSDFARRHLDGALGHEGASKEIADAIDSGGGGGGTWGSITGTLADQADLIDKFNRGVTSHTVQLTDAQIKALGTTDFELVPAPGSGKAIYVQFVVFAMSMPGGDNYTNVGADASLGVGITGVPRIYVPNDSGGGLTYLTQLIANGDGAALCIRPTFPAASGWDTDIDNNSVPGISNDNLAIFLTTDGSNTGDFTGGAAGNVLTVTTYYTVIDV